MALVTAAVMASACEGGDPRPATSVSTADAGGRDRDAGAGADAARPSPRPDGGPILPPADSELSLPFGGPSARFVLRAEASLGALDLHLSIDTTASMDAEIDTLQRDLTRVLLPELQALVPLLSIGVSRFEDFPARPFGVPRSEGLGRADRPFELLTPITSVQAAIDGAVAMLDQPLGNGGDVPESGAEALFQIATGAGYRAADGDELIAAYDLRPVRGGGRIGGVGFREGALHVVLHVTDAPSHAPDDYGSVFPGTRSLDEATAALLDIDARVVSIVSGFCADDVAEPCDDRFALRARAELEQVALDTGAHVPPNANGDCPHGLDGAPRAPRAGSCPLVFDVSGEAERLSSTFVGAVAGLVDGIRFKRVTAFASDDPLGFVRRVVPLASDSDDAPAIADLLPEGAPDGEPDSFVDARASAPLAFEVVLDNDKLAPRAEAQRFRVVLQIRGDDLIVAEHVLRIVVPAGPLPNNPLEDAGP